MAARIHGNSYAQLAIMLQRVMDSRGINSIQWVAHYVDHGIGKDPHVRARWDAFWTIPTADRQRWLDENTPLLDDHIDTALRRYFD